MSMHIPVLYVYTIRIIRFNGYFVKNAQDVDWKLKNLIPPEVKLQYLQFVVAEGSVAVEAGAVDDSYIIFCLYILKYLIAHLIAYMLK